MSETAELTEDYDTLSRVFAALGHPVRLQILARALEGEYCVQDLGEHLDRSQPNISQHLAILRDRGLVVPRRRGKKVCYRLADERLADVLRMVAEIFD